MSVWFWCISLCNGCGWNHLQCLCCCYDHVLAMSMCLYLCVVARVSVHLVVQCVWRVYDVVYFIALASCKSSLVPCVQLVLWHDHISKSCSNTVFPDPKNLFTISARLDILGLRKHESVQNQFYQGLYNPIFQRAFWYL